MEDKSHILADIFLEIKLQRVNADRETFTRIYFRFRIVDVARN